MLTSALEKKSPLSKDHFIFHNPTIKYTGPLRLYILEANLTYQRGYIITQIWVSKYGNFKILEYIKLSNLNTLISGGQTLSCDGFYQKTIVLQEPKNL